jgi:hypothetical protein
MIYLTRLSIATNESVFAMAGYFMFRPADTEVEFCFFAENNYKCSIALGHDDDCS